MNTAYSSEIHNFITTYFKSIGAKITDMPEDYFIVTLSSGEQRRYTYIPRVSAENKEIILLAKGSKEFKAIVQECNNRAAFSHVNATYNLESVTNSLMIKQCCDLCPFITLCNNCDTCCKFCPSYKSCNTHIENAVFQGFGNLISSKPLKVIAFIFSVELSNDYSLSQKLEKNITILINLETEEIIPEIIAKGFTDLDLTPPEEERILTHEKYSFYLKHARQGAEESLRDQLDAFKKEIEEPIRNKINAIFNKFGEEFAESYTKTSLEQLDEIQVEALRLCEREIKGYTINCSYNLKNAILINTSIDERELIFQQEKSEKEIGVLSEIFLSCIKIKCSECGIEIDKATLCDDGHVLCKKCCEFCNDCKSTICSICDQESYICSTCNESICSDCVIKCSSCGDIICSSHAYICATCGEKYCINCYEICDVCEGTVCNSHAASCSECGEPLCPTHTHSCSVCNEKFGDNHIDKCSICDELLCVEHGYSSSYSQKTICEIHTSHCTVCEDLFAQDEISTCTKCNDNLCPNHIKNCDKCGNIYCRKHINHCRGCGVEVCDCTPFNICKFCGEEYCSDCIDQKGYCTACRDLVKISEMDSLLENVITEIPKLEKFKKFYLGKSHEMYILYAKGLISNHLVVLNKNKEIIKNRDVNFIEDLRSRNNLHRKHRN